MWRSNGRSSRKAFKRTVGLNLYVVCNRNDVIVCGLYACSGLYVRSSCYIPLDVNSTWAICMYVQDYM